MADLTTARPRESIVVAMTRQGLIGSGGQLPWRVPDELRLFRATTLDSTVIMGRITFTGLGRPLPQRRNLVVSTTLAEQTGIIVCRDFASAVTTALVFPEPICYIGGREIYRQALPRVETLYVSWMEGSYTGDDYFPTVEWREWEAQTEIPGDGFVQICYRRRPRLT